MAVAAKTTVIPFTSGDLVVIVPSDTTTYDPPLRGLYVGGAAGNVAITSHQGTTNTSATHSSVAAGGQVNGVGLITAVLSTGTTATGIIGVR